MQIAQEIFSKPQESDL